MRPTQDEAIIRRIRAEFLEMPGLELTPRQASRLWGLDEATCEGIIETLIKSAFLQRTTNGRVKRAGD